MFVIRRDGHGRVTRRTAGSLMYAGVSSIVTVRRELTQGLLGGTQVGTRRPNDRSRISYFVREWLDNPAHSRGILLEQWDELLHVASVVTILRGR
jgi:hypothetical protein